jgi:hypothetical protein
MRRPAWFEPVDSAGEWIGLLGGIAVVCGIALLIAWNGVRLSNGDVRFSELMCIDPTDACNWSAYRVRNDTAEPVVLRECMHHCGAGDQRLDPIAVAPGQTTANSVRDVSALVATHDWWEVRLRSGRLLGCLVLDGHPHKHDGDRVSVAGVGPCTPEARITPFEATGEP